MRNILSDYRARRVEDAPITGNPCYLFNPKGMRELFVCVSSDPETLASGWEHVSVSVPKERNSCPTWPEMEAVKRLVWGEDVACMQWHPREDDYFHGAIVGGVNMFPEVLHIWRPADGDWSKLTDKGPDAFRKAAAYTSKAVDKLMEAMG